MDYGDRSDYDYEAKMPSALWFKQKTLECALSYNTGLKNSRRSPFACLRDFIPDLPKKNADAIIFLANVMLDNHIHISDYYMTAYDKAIKSKF